VAPLIAEPWARRQAPVSGYDAKWALPWCLAARLQSGPLTVERFALPPDPAATALAGRIAPVAMADHGFPARFAARLTVTLRDGSVRDVTVPNVRGAPDRPVPDEPVRAKFRANAARALPDAAIRTLEDAVLAIEAPDAPAALARALAAATG
jgi:2-methylcitrate dehydratase PrpD